METRRLSLRPLPRRFYDRETELVARELIGCVLECSRGGDIVRGIITETEAYLGEHDPACHAAVGRTRRTEGLYGPPGTAYVYFIYGMYWCVNAVTRAEGLPSAVLIRGVQPVHGIDIMRRRRQRAGRQVPDKALADGPGKLCLALGIDGPTHHGADLVSGSTLRILRGAPVDDALVAVTPRIGISKAKDWPLRWVVRGEGRG
ncbi:MAG: DNA-3-methyladenine glycosylase [Gemmatimonadetes bacterium]|nr:DNA-3-methyladenine glycosylase [Gemmatimonadota bacterium]